MEIKLSHDHGYGNWEMKWGYGIWKTVSTSRKSLAAPLSKNREQLVDRGTDDGNFMEWELESPLLGFWKRMLTSSWEAMVFAAVSDMEIPFPHYLSDLAAAHIFIRTRAWEIGDNKGQCHGCRRDVGVKHGGFDRRDFSLQKVFIGRVWGNRKNRKRGR